MKLVDEMILIAEATLVAKTMPKAETMLMAGKSDL